MEFTVLIVDDEEEMCLSIAELLQAAGLNALYTTVPLEVPGIIKSKPVDFIIMDIKMPGLSGLDLLQMIKEFNSAIPIAMITGFPSIDNAVLAMKYGAIDFLTKPLDVEKLIKDLKHIAKIKRENANDTLPVTIVYQSKIIDQIINKIRKIAPTDAPVIIFGESGTGKELFAELIHSLSPRRNEAMIKINCSAIPETLLESELFGHEAGAFTDAKKSLTGKFELAQNGTLFLDEIGDMALSIQPKILRVLEDGKIQRLGSEKLFEVNPRIVAASNRDIYGMIDAGSFRKDLFYRLSVAAFEIPPLRQRKEDIMILAAKFIEEFNPVFSKNVKGISEEVKGIFLRHSWPGNIRELRNCIQHAVIFADGDIVQKCDLSSQYNEIENLIYDTGIENLVDALTREQILEALEKAGGVKYKAAELLNINRKTLYNRMKNLGME